ncbi:phospholipase/carboxylesterase [Hamiltosporidium tvaerminnensis]|uniref:Acyl-protein thioesterase 1 n=2 Tax=Hamiltosporidium TaxID=1176354 RepID=A0A4Q9LJ23_9MICR|nr:hypothetical protein LUQ84_000612 [Hamiltosporidium tvaerminnensis]TBT99820.1 phospholipase/carboxylesterase [Hamiltosporidium tvaerminnensis]TBU00933.1 phospholipase/carboxylesterase [Hamiltosporidium magnivora]TBU07271.1 phospholipase/carboxylesterase [Hamiltosporidium magnivora]TBU13232.1 phospholipase/carboxylesterase [Hamiltosporidium tvaerminnensis]
MYISMKNPIILNPLATEYLLIFLHGLGDNGENISSIFESYAKRYRNTRMIFPTAMKRKIGICANMEMNAWFNIQSLDLEYEDYDGYRESMENIMKIFNEQNIAPTRTIIAGFSQGGAMSLYIALNEIRYFKSIICCSGFLIDRTNAKNIVKQNITMIHGNKDIVVLPMFGEKSFEILKNKYKQNVKLIKFHGDHTIPNIAFDTIFDGFNDKDLVL